MRLPSIYSLLILVLCTLALYNCSSTPTAVLPPSGAPPAIFKTYRPNGESVWNKGWVRSFDLTGVAFDKPQTCTLITPRHAVMAKHYKRKIHSKVVFHDRKGIPHVRFIRSIEPCKGDVAVALLDRPLPDGIATYALPNSATPESNVIGRPIAVTDKRRGLYFHQVRSLSGLNLGMQFDPAQPHGTRKSLISGDSGNPSFLVQNGQLILAETHLSGGAGSGPYYGNSEIQESIRKAVAKLDSDYQIRTTLINP